MNDPIWMKIYLQYRYMSDNIYLYFCNQSEKKSQIHYLWGFFVAIWILTSEFESIKKTISSPLDYEINFWDKNFMFTNKCLTISHRLTATAVSAPNYKKDHIDRVALCNTRRSKRCSVLFYINFLAACMAAHYWNFVCGQILSCWTNSRLEHFESSFGSGLVSCWNLLFLLVEFVFIIQQNFGTWFNILSLVWSLYQIWQTASL